MKTYLNIFCVIICLLASKSCTFENEEDYFGVPICDSTLVDRDTLEVYYEDLTYIFGSIDNQENYVGVCIQCHNLDYTYRGGILMDSYEDVVNSMNTGKVLPAIKHEGRYFMPLDQPKLLDCEIQNIIIWYENGMPRKNE